MNLTFGDKIKILRKGKRLTQTQFANIFGLSLRTIQNYEKGISYPKQTEIYVRIAAFFNVTVEYLITGVNYSFSDYETRKMSQQDVQNLIVEIGGLFADSDLSEEEKDMLIQALNNMYWASKAKSRGRGLTGKNKFMPENDEE